MSPDVRSSNTRISVCDNKKGRAQSARPSWVVIGRYGFDFQRASAARRADAARSSGVMLAARA